MRRVFCFLLCFLLLFSLPAKAAEFSDINGHWAKDSIMKATELGFMNGTGGTSFEPDANVTRAMFVTVLGRFAGIDQAQWASDVKLFTDTPTDKYYSAYVAWAARTGITNGTGNGLFSPHAPITREQLITILMRFTQVTGLAFRGVVESVAFQDMESVSLWARDSVTAMQGFGILNGIRDGNGYRFAPKTLATRAQAAAIFCRLASITVKDTLWVDIPMTLISLNKTSLSLTSGESATLTAQPYPADCTNRTLFWYSTDPSVAKVENGVVTYVSPGTCSVVALSAYSASGVCQVTCTAPKKIIVSDLSYSEKCDLIFGKYVSDPRAVYGSSAEASANMVEITVRTWDIGTNGKYTRQWSIVVHKNIAPTVEAIFEEIYALPAQYPVHALGGFRYEARSEHNCGLAIDINPNENYYCSPSGQALSGSFFDPDRSEYSFPVGGEIDQIFAKYGFTRGIYWRSGYKDYMHYSFFGT